MDADPGRLVDEVRPVTAIAVADDTSTESWERAAAVAVERAAGSLRDLRIAEVILLDMHVEDGKVSLYRAKVKLSFKYEEQPSG